MILKKIIKMSYCWHNDILQRSVNCIVIRERAIILRSFLFWFMRTLGLSPSFGLCVCVRDLFLTKWSSHSILMNIYLLSIWIFIIFIIFLYAVYCIRSYYIICNAFRILANPFDPFTDETGPPECLLEL